MKHKNNKILKLVGLLAIILIIVVISVLLRVTNSKPVKMVSGNILIPKVGDMFSIGTERFYVISSDAKTVTGLAEYNLYVGGEYDCSKRKWIEYGSEATGLQNSEIKGFVSSEYIYKGTTKFGPSIQYNGSIVEKYVTEYNEKLKNMGVQSVKASLITKETLENFGCNSSSYTCKKSKYPWLYSTTYWINDPKAENLSVGIVVSTGFFSSDFSFSTNDEYYGVRPVVTISKSEF